MQPDDTEYTGLLSLLPKQKEAYRQMLEADQGSYLLLGYGGSQGSGKSALIGRAINDLLLAYPGISVLLCRQQLTTLKETTLREFFRQLNPALISKKNENESWVEVRDPSWPAGIASRLKYLGIADVEKSGSAQYQAIFFDEASEAEGEMGHYAASYLLGRMRFGFFPKNVEAVLRSQCGHVDVVKGDCGGPTEFNNLYCKPGICYEHDDFVKCSLIPQPEPICPKHGPIKGNGVKYIFFAASNPYPGFFTDWFWKKELAKVEQALPGKMACRFIHALPTDNIYNGENYVEIMRATMTPDQVKRLVEGRFDVFAGLVYEALDPDIHAWHGPIPEYRRATGGIDLGFEQTDAHYTAAIVHIHSRAGRLIRVEEFVDRGPGVYERLGKWMARMHEKWAKPQATKIRWVCDRSQGLGISELKKSFDIVASAGGRDSVEAGVRSVAIRMNKDGNGLPGSYYLPDGHDQGGVPKWLAKAKEWVRDQKTHELTDEPDILASDRYAHEAAGQTWGDPARFLNQVGRVK